MREAKCWSVLACANQVTSSGCSWIISCIPPPILLQWGALEFMLLLANGSRLQNGSVDCSCGLVVVSVMEKRSKAIPESALGGPLKGNSSSCLERLQFEKSSSSLNTEEKELSRLRLVRVTLEKASGTMWSSKLGQVLVIVRFSATDFQCRLACNILSQLGN